MGTALVVKRQPWDIATIQLDQKAPVPWALAGDEIHRVSPEGENQAGARLVTLLQGLTAGFRRNCDMPP
jgi:hypothetical protein